MPPREFAFTVGGTTEASYLSMHAVWWAYLTRWSRSGIQSFLYFEVFITYYYSCSYLPSTFPCLSACLTVCSFPARAPTDQSIGRTWPSIPSKPSIFIACGAGIDAQYVRQPWCVASIFLPSKPSCLAVGPATVVHGCSIQLGAGRSDQAWWDRFRLLST